MRTENWELNQIANNSGVGGSQVVDKSFREDGEDSEERESERLAERENEENEVSLLPSKQKSFNRNSLPSRIRPSSALWCYLHL